MGKIVRKRVDFGGSSNSADRIKYDDTKNVKVAIDEINSNLEPICDLLLTANDTVTTLYDVSDLNKYKYIMLCASYGNAHIVDTTIVPLSLFKTYNSTSKMIQSRYTDTIDNVLKVVAATCFYSSDTKIGIRSTNSNLYCKIYGFN